MGGYANFHEHRDTTLLLRFNILTYFYLQVNIVVGLRQIVW